MGGKENAKHEMDQYLDDITLSLEIDKDVELYRVDKAISNREMGVMGVHILDPALRALYDGNVYLLRAFCKGKKYFEMPLSKF